MPIKLLNTSSQLNGISCTRAIASNFFQYRLVVKELWHGEYLDENHQKGDSGDAIH
jgi:hypothetical protein